MSNLDRIPLVPSEISLIHKRFFDQAQQSREELFTLSIYASAEPKIKGEITKGKLKWRGIRIVEQTFGFSSFSWVEQRGKQISPKFQVNINLPDNF